MAWTKLALVSDLPPGSLIEIEHGGELYALCNVGGAVRAITGVCPHEGGPLGEGALSGDVVTCPWHMWEFDSATGICTFDEAVRIATYPARVEENAILVDLPINRLK